MIAVSLAVSNFQLGGSPGFPLFFIGKPPWQKPPFLLLGHLS
jgi:hypothetical protein